MFSTEQLIKMALTEDLGTGDITTMSTVPSNSISTATVTFKEAGVVAGLDIFALVFRTLDASLKIEFQAHCTNRPTRKTSTKLVMKFSV